MSMARDYQARSAAMAPIRSQRGAALLAALIFLVVLTIIGVGVVGTTTTEEKMARNFRDNDIAFAAAEAALRDAEIRINGLWSNPAQPIDPYSFSDSCTDGLCNSLPGGGGVPVDKQPVYDHFSMTASPSSALGTVTNSPAIVQVSAQPRYLIEKVRGRIPGESGSGTTYYRITAIGFGRLSAQTMLQETYRPNP